MVVGWLKVEPQGDVRIERTMQSQSQLKEHSRKRAVGEIGGASQSLKTRSVGSLEANAGEHLQIGSHQPSPSKGTGSYG
jgi:hypothetical protein